jgi:hypothetical protein
MSLSYVPDPEPSSVHPECTIYALSKFPVGKREVEVVSVLEVVEVELDDEVVVLSESVVS